MQLDCILYVYITMCVCVCVCVCCIHTCTCVLFCEHVDAWQRYMYVCVLFMGKYINKLLQIVYIHTYTLHTAQQVSDADGSLFIRVGRHCVIWTMYSVFPLYTQSQYNTYQSLYTYHVLLYVCTYVSCTCIIVYKIRYTILHICNSTALMYCRV